MDEEELRFALARLEDLARRCEETNCLSFSAFFGFSEQSALLAALAKRNQKEEIGGIPYLLYGGESESERRCFVFLPSYLDPQSFLEEEKKDPEILLCLRIAPKAEKFASSSSHRDYLGALLSLGIERNRIGDILVGEKDAYAYVTKDLASDISENLASVGRNAVKVEILPPFSCPYAPEFEEKRVSVASLRLDALLAAVFHLSREEAKRQIEAGNVFLTSTSAKPDVRPSPGEHISLKGKGKFVFLEEVGSSKKGKLVVSVKLPR